MGIKRYKGTVLRSQADFSEEAVLHDGRIVDRPYRADIAVENYTKGTALTAQDLTATSDTLTVSVIKAALLYVDDVDKIQNKYSAANLWADEAMKRLEIALDGRYLAEVFTSNNNVDSGDLGGTAGEGITLTTANLPQIFAEINEELDLDNVPLGERFFNISPQFKNVLWQYIQSKESMLGDKTGEHGNIGQFAGLKLYLTNNSAASARWTPANNPSDADTITIEGITFTFKTTIGTTAGNILIAGSTALTIDNLVALIDGGGTTSDSGVSNVSVSDANKRVVQEWDGVDGTTYFEVRGFGENFLTVSGSDATDVWNAPYKIQHLLAGRVGAISVVVQSEPKVEMDKTVSAGKLGMNIIPYTLAGFKTFNQGANETVNVKIRSDAF